jgi:hypothetical protein
MSMMDTSGHIQDRPVSDHDAMRCVPPGDSRRYRDRTDSFEAKITKM